MTKIIRTMSNKFETNESSQKTCYLICSYGHEESGFDYPAEKFLTEATKVFAQWPKVTKNVLFLRKTFLLILFLWTRRKLLWKTLPKFFYQKAEIFELSFRKGSKNRIFSKKTFLQKFARETLNELLTTPLKIFRQKDENNSLIVWKCCEKNDFF